MKKTFLAGVAAALVLAAPASAAPKSFWFDCGGTTPVQTIDVSDYTWSETAPAQSYQEGAGCGFLDPGALQGANQPNPLYDAGFGGSYNGEVRKFEITLYAPTTPATDKAINLQLIVNGATVNTYTKLAPTVTPGPDDAISAYTYTADDVDLPAAGRERSIVFAVAGSYADDTPGWLQGAKEVPSNVKLFAFDDLTPEEQAAITVAGA